MPDIEQLRPPRVLLRVVFPPVRRVDARLPKPSVLLPSTQRINISPTLLVSYKLT